MQYLHVSQRVNRLRQEMGLSQAELARRLGKPQSRISDIERGKRPIHIDDLPLFAKALGTTVEYLVTGNKPENAAVASDLGLSDLAIKTLRNNHAKTNESDVKLKSYGETISALLSHPGVITYLSLYLFEPLEGFRITKDDTEITVKEGDMIKLSPSNAACEYPGMEITFAFALISKLKELRELIQLTDWHV